jgi:aminopeptidase YwaD
MKYSDQLSKVKTYVGTLCAVEPNRRTGSSGNRTATDYVANIMRGWGYDVDTTPFVCLDHEIGEACLVCKETPFEVFVSPYSQGCDVVSELVTVSTIEELKAIDCATKLLLMKDTLTTEQLMPKNFVFYNPEHHRKTFSLLEAKRPAAIITSTGKDLDMVGNIYPFPVIEDGDFNIPSVYCKDIIGDEIASRTGQVFHLKTEAQRIPAQASNVISRKNLGAAKKIIICAHLDAKETTPGASDDAAGIAVELLLAELLADYHGDMGIEIVAFNGEDNYTAGGEMDYLTRYGNDLDRVDIAMNIDDVGFVNGKTNYSFYECPEGLRNKVKSVFHNYSGLIEGEQWYSGDHMIFAQKAIPSMAITSERVIELMHTVTHTPADVPEILDYKKLVELAAALKQLVMTL